jgi:hypothetical protein
MTLFTTRASVTIANLRLPLAVVCHDAGGANQIIAMLRDHDLAALEVKPVMQGPALNLWRNAFPDLPSFPDLQTALHESGSLLSGTGWASDLEHQARLLAKQLHIPSIAVLDHWVNYPARFVRNDVTVLPDTIWVTDTDAEKLALAEFPATPIQLVPNPYLESQREQLSKPDQLLDPHLLFVCEPSLSTWGRDIAGEFQALNYFLSQLHHLDVPTGTRILLRPHPSEPAGKYANWLAQNAHHPIFLDESLDLISAMRNAQWVVGCQSYAMAVALSAGRQVYSALPPWAPPCRLPQSGIIHLKLLP